MRRLIGIFILLFCFGFNSNALTENMQITLRPYIGAGYSFSYHQNSQFGGINYQSVLPHMFNSFGGMIGVRSNYFSMEFSVFGAIPSDSTTNNGGSYGISGSRMDLWNMRITGIVTLHADMFGDENNLLLIVGMIHSFSNIKYNVSNAALLPTGLQYGGFGTNAEFGIGYMRDFGRHFAMRTDVRYSPMVISGMTSHMVTVNFAVLGIL